MLLHQRNIDSVKHSCIKEILIVKRNDFFFPENYLFFSWCNGQKFLHRFYDVIMLPLFLKQLSTFENWLVVKIFRKGKRNVNKYLLLNGNGNSYFCLHELTHVLWNNYFKIHFTAWSVLFALELLVIGAGHCIILSSVCFAFAPLPASKQQILRTYGNTKVWTSVYISVLSEFRWGVMSTNVDIPSFKPGPLINMNLLKILDLDDVSQCYKW